MFKLTAQRWRRLSDRRISHRAYRALTRLLFGGITVLSAQRCLLAQFEPQLPKDPAVLQQRLKDIEGADNPDDASLAFEDMRDALKQANDYKETITPNIRAHLAQLDVNEKEFQNNLAAARSTVQSCTKETELQAIRTLSTPSVGMISSNIIPFTYTKTFTAIQGLQGLPPDKFCAALKPGPGSVQLDRAFADDLAQDRREAQQDLIAATQLGDAYVRRYTSLKELRNKLTKETGLRGDMLWIVAGVCLFACITLGVIRLYSPDQAMEFIKSGQLIQFPTVMILLVVIVVLGLTSILQENTLGTLLGGVAGYVLSQGVGRAAFRDAERTASGQRAGVTPPAA